MFKILVSDPLAQEGVDILKKVKEFQVDVKHKLPPEELKKIIKDYDALLVRSETKVTKDIIEAAINLKVIGRAGVGLDNVDLRAASKRGIIVMNTPGGNTMSTAEHAVSLMLSLSRNIPQADGSVKKGEWERKKFMGAEVYGKTLGIIGLGRIGTEVAKRAIAFGMKVITYDPFLSLDKARELGIESGELKVIFEKADYITVHSPLTEETKHIIDKKAIEKMKHGVRIINCARGGIIDETAVLEGIAAGKIAGAAFDVYEKEPPVKDNPLFKCDKVVLTPHLGASTEEAQINVAVEIAGSARDALLGCGIRNAVNVPCVDFELYKILQPYINLGEKIGGLASQLAKGRTQEIQIKYSGDVVKYNLSPITVAIVKGVLSPVLQETVNYVNSLIVAKERGIKIEEMKATNLEEYSSLISVEIKTDIGVRTVSGTLFTKKDPRIVKIDEFHVDAIPEGYMIVAHNIDVPGIIGMMGTILGKNNINIAAMTFGREKPGGKTLSVLNIDSAVSEKVLNEIRKDKNILDATLIKL
ncbi:MAG: phosphoglycerate dehydrogenase [Candidatus Omnitrophica bacterium CG_4_9_14_0_2_um_filter_42_8]|nr:MAG: phosphoglycerate dehydrogenase [Candidatus Omnitrophica bacterium CG22_combo_CG10-13_8_21_14_all_43_16]PJC48303.1 MAG: phosphoglycerate dehydrogenase [Candidatus Omnitrophica bacterium CG_4_9_14_0_2_um_filter_42_8]